MKDHELAQLVNKLRDVAVCFYNHQSLRARISQLVFETLFHDPVAYELISPRGGVHYTNDLLEVEKYKSKEFVKYGWKVVPLYK